MFVHLSIDGAVAVVAVVAVVVAAAVLLLLLVVVDQLNTLNVYRRGQDCI